MSGQQSTIEAVATDTKTVLGLRGLSAGYDRATVLHDIDLVVEAGKTVALLGPNGAGKTTLLRAATGLIKSSAGRVIIEGVDVTKAPPNRRARAGLCLIPEGRGIFRGLTVADNLKMQMPPWASDQPLDRVFEAFPILSGRMSQVAGTMSGGQQQMLALARAYLSNPHVVLLDEVSMGLAPKVVDEIFEALGKLAKSGVALLLVEQYVIRALDMADSVVLLDRGRIAFNGPPSGIDRETVLRGYLGAGQAS
jgi:branched-chain amino acid transport system ATP-binding protein